MKVKVAGGREAEICSVRKDVGGVWMLADILALLAVVGCWVLVWKEKRRREVLAGWRREKVSWRPEDVRLCKETRREKLAAEGMPALCPMSLR